MAPKKAKRKQRLNPAPPHEKMRFPKPPKKRGASFLCLCRQRKQYRTPKLSNERQQLSKEIEFPFDQPKKNSEVNDAIWEAFYQTLANSHKQHGHSSFYASIRRQGKLVNTFSSAPALAHVSLLIFFTMCAIQPANMGKSSKKITEAKKVKRR